MLRFLRCGFKEAVLNPTDFGLLRRNIQPKYLRFMPPTHRTAIPGKQTPVIILPLVDGRRIVIHTWDEWPAPS